MSLFFYTRKWFSSFANRFLFNPINEVKIENYKVFLIKKPKRKIVFSSLEYNVALEKGLPRQGH
jgi:hypothetical protein